MTYLVYENCDENTKTFISIVLILFILGLIGIVAYNWLVELIKNKFK